MRLSIVFLLVLAFSAIVASMAAWGISYGTSYSRASAMVVRFTTLGQDSFATFGSFVSNLFGDNVALVDAVLAAQEASGVQRSQLTQEQIAQTIGVLVTYTTNSTDQTQRQMGAAADAFGALMGSVVGQFKDLASGYVAQVRADLAATGKAAILTAAAATRSAIQRFQLLINNGLLDLTRAPTDPVGEADCMLLGVLCDAGTEIGAPLTVVSATGRYYTCGITNDFTVTFRNITGGVYNEYQMNWFRGSTALLAPKQRCLAESPVVTSVGKFCALPFNCTCGKDLRCSAWYQALVTTNSSFLSGMFASPLMHTAMPLLDLSATPPAFLGAVDSEQNLGQTQKLLPALPGTFNQTYLALLLNDTYLTMLGNLVRPCQRGVTKPSNASLPSQSAFRSCDMGLRAVAQWIVDNRTFPESVTLEIDGILWDVSPVISVTTSYFFVVGTNKSEAFHEIDASEAKASSQLAAVRSVLSSQVAAAGATTRDYVAALGAQNVRATQAMQDTFLAELQALQNSSRANLADSQASSFATQQLVGRTGLDATEEQLSAELRTMGVTAGWTIAVVVGLLLGVLGASTFGTVRVTNSLNRIIGLMEDVADMKVENLTIPQGSSVQEVARIQTAFEALVQRLALYKSYIPAGVFEQLEQLTQKEGDGGSEDGHGSDDNASERARQRSPHGSHCERMANRHSSLCDSPGHAPLLPLLVGRQTPTRPVAVLALNLVGTMDLLRQPNEALSKTVLNEYVTIVHEAVSQGRGNIDFLMGDQVYATFNAHVSCSDPSGAAAAVALDLPQKLLAELGDRLNFTIGLSFGPVFVSTAGYAKFKFMVALGEPMKMARVLSHVEHLEPGTVLVDTNLQERVKYSFDCCPVELLHLPWLKSVVQDVAPSQPIYMLVSKKKLQEGEWLYQVAEGDDFFDWNQTFQQLVAANTAEELEGVLQQYLALYPTDHVAVRLQSRLALWIPGKGIPL